ncbi:DUF6551 family protein [Streptomyces sp. NPDC050145]|uniref:DUF6551 family protein n=1 Tax=Streptomyces sp. NPDC050145 TaxID=3365602 RepID=UPI003796E7DE
MVSVVVASQIELLAPDVVGTDPRVNTRPVDKSWVARKFKEGFDERRLGIPQVSAREDGTFIWVDGQNRGALCKMAGRGAVKVRMKVFHGLSLAEEAELFLGLNDNRRVLPLYKFLAEVTAGRPESLEITRIAEKFGWKVSDSKGNSIAAVSALTAIYRSSPRPGRTLETVLQLVTDAWGHAPDGVNAQVLLGIASFINDCPAISEGSLRKKLAQYEGGPSLILGKGRGFRATTGCTVQAGVDQVVRGIYNASRRNGRVPTWGAPAPRGAGQDEQMRMLV